jgi:Holliday junction resolvase RusA-like endonuclease
MNVTFEVLGLPAPQGSKKAFVVGGKARMTESAGAKGYAWRDSVSAAARDVAGHDDVDAPLDGPLTVEILFRFPVPKSRARKVPTGPWGSLPKTTSPDVDKLARSVLDGLTAGGLISDDSLVVRLVAEKCEVLGWTGAQINVLPWHS